MNNKPQKNLHLGEIFEVNTSQGFFYIQYCNFDPLLGYLMCKLGNKFAQSQLDLKRLSELEIVYYFFYPLHASLKQKCVKRVGRTELQPQSKAMPIFVNPIDKVIVGLEGIPLWEIIEPAGKNYKVKKLSEKQKTWPLWQIITHTGLEICLNNDWSPYKANTNYEIHGTTWINSEIL